MKKLYLMGMVILLIPFSICAQSTERSVIASSGNSLTNGNVQLDWTLGEPVTSTQTSNEIIITTGFHQSTLIITKARLEESISCKVFPNPTQDFVFVELPVNIGNTTITLSDANGKILLLENNVSTNYKINFSQLAMGNYVVNIKNQSRISKYKIQKISN